MIDEKKIDEAAIAFDNKAEWAEDADAQAIVQYSFKKGANWAIKEFKKSLWHDMTEYPKRQGYYAVKTKTYIDICFFYKPKIGKAGWQDTFTGKENMLMWLDFNDTLPKEGGEK